MCPAGHADYHY
jgi:hypothetical protein